MATTVKIGEEITIGTTATEYVIDETYALLSKPFQDLQINTAAGNGGTIQFAVGEAPGAAAEAVAANKTRLIKGVQNGFRNLWADGSGAGQKFTIA